MSDFVLLRSACGKGGKFVDIYDAPLNTEGVICCDECSSIVACREAWYQVYGNPNGVLV